MKKLNNIIVFIIIPIAIIALLFLNGNIAHKQYSNKLKEIANNQYIAVISANENEVSCKTKETIKIGIKLTNGGYLKWHVGEPNPINISYHIYDESGKQILVEGERTSITKELDKGEGLELEMNFQAPEKPGKYKIELDMVHEGITWFKDKGSNTTFIDLEVME